MIYTVIITLADASYTCMCLVSNYIIILKNAVTKDKKRYHIVIVGTYTDKAFHSHT